MMVSQLLDRVSVERVQAEAREVHPGQALLTLLARVFWLVGWLVGMLVVAVTFAWAAARLGYQDARGQVEAGPRGSVP